MNDETGPRWADILAHLLSPHATAYYERTGSRRAAAFACDRAGLAGMLAERGLPIFDAVLAYEALIGGVSEALLAHEQLYGKRISLTLDGLLTYEGKLLLPLTAIPTYEHWMDESGTIYLVNQDVDYCEPSVESFIHVFEQGAFREDLESYKAPPPGSDAARRPFGFQLWSHLGETIAKALDVPLFEPASDKYGPIWYGERAFIKERRLRKWEEWTAVRVSSMDLAVLAVQAATKKDPGARGEWQSTIDKQPAADAPIAARFWFGPSDPCGPTSIYGEVQIVRGSDGYRVHLSRA